MKRKKVLTQKISEAIDAKDKDLLRKLMKEAERNNVDNAVVKSARIIVDREKLIKETNEKLKSSAENGDLAALNEALETSIELGLEGEQIEEAQIARDRLEKEASLAATVNAEIKTCQTKSQSSHGIVASDVTPVKEKLDAAVASGLPESSKMYEKANNFIKSMEKQLEVQVQLKEYLDEYNEKTFNYPSLNDVKAFDNEKLSASSAQMEGIKKKIDEVLETSTELGMTMNGIEELRDIRRTLDSLVRSMKQAKNEREDYEDDEEDEDEDDEEEEDEEEAERLREERKSKALNANYS